MFVEALRLTLVASVATLLARFGPSRTSGARDRTRGSLMSSRVRRAGLAVFAVALALTGAVYGVARSTAANAAVQLTAPQLVADMGAGVEPRQSAGGRTPTASPSETAWGQPGHHPGPHRPGEVHRAHSRRSSWCIPVSYLGSIWAAPNYTVDSAWLSSGPGGRQLRLQLRPVRADQHARRRLQEALTGPRLVCDASDQTTIKAKYQKVWQRKVATKFASYNDHLISRSMNVQLRHGKYGNPSPAVLLEHRRVQPGLRRHRSANPAATNASRWLLIPGWNTNIEYTDRQLWLLAGRRLVDRAGTMDEERIPLRDEHVVHRLELRVQIVFLAPGRLLEGWSLLGPTA